MPEIVVPYRGETGKQRLAAPSDLVDLGKIADHLKGLALRSERRSNIFLEASYDDPRLAVRNA